MDQAPSIAPTPSAPRKAPRRLVRFGLVERVGGWVLGRPVFAVAWLTLKAAFRYRLIQALLVILLMAVVGLPAVIKHDGTAQGFTQILLTYTLGAVTTLLGFVTLWLACGTLARDVEECQIQLVAVKPIARWQIWMGKWLGILGLNAFLLGISGLAIHGLLEWRVGRLPTVLQQEVRSKILVARGAAKPPAVDAEIDAAVEKLYQQRLKEGAVTALDRDFVLKQIRERVKAQFQIVPPGMLRRWSVPLGRPADGLRDRSLYVRAKFFAAQTTRSGNYEGFWEIGPPEGRRLRLDGMSLAADTYYEFEVPGSLLDPDGKLVIDFRNYNETALLFPIQGGMEVLYPEAGFLLNFIRGLGILFCWLALLAAIGLATASFLSFPVAAFVSLALLVVGFSTGTLKQVVQEGGVTAVNHETGRIDMPTVIDHVAVPLFKGLLATITLVQEFSPIDSLSSGRSVTWGQLGRAVLQVVVLTGGVFAGFGMYMFHRRELAAAQGA